MNKVSLIQATQDCDLTNHHHSCDKCDNGKYPTIEMVNISKGMSIQQKTIRNKLILLVKGKIKYSYGIYTEIEVSGGTLFYCLKAL